MTSQVRVSRVGMFDFSGLVASASKIFDVKGKQIQ